MGIFQDVKSLVSLLITAGLLADFGLIDWNEMSIKNTVAEIIGGTVREIRRLNKSIQETANPDFARILRQSREVEFRIYCSNLEWFKDITGHTDWKRCL